jgi:hypothetical protein
MGCYRVEWIRWQGLINEYLGWRKDLIFSVRLTGIWNHLYSSLKPLEYPMGEYMVLESLLPFPDISDLKAKKEQALRCYQAQFSSEELDQFLMILEMKSRMWGEEHGVDFAEGLKVMHPLQLHCGF